MSELQQRYNIVVDDTMKIVSLDTTPCNIQTKTLLMTMRQAMIMILGAIEDYLGMERSIIPKHKR